MAATQTRATSSMTPQRRCSSRTQIFRCPSILAFASLLQLASGFQFDIPPNTHECFDEQTKASDHVTGTWQVVAPKTPEALAGWKVTVTSPDGESVYSADNERQGAFDYYASAEGVYVVCFKNDGQPLTVSAKIQVGDPPDLIQLAKTEHLSPVEERIKSLHESMNAVRDLQDQMREQDEAQAKMTRSTRTWLLYFTLIEATVLVGVTVWQNLYLKSFFEVKRVV